MNNSFAATLKEMGITSSILRILDNSYDGVMITAKDSTIIFVNSAYSRILGVPIEKVLGKKLSSIEPDSITLKALNAGREALHVSERVASLNETIFGSVLLLPSADNPIGSVSIITKPNQELEAAHDFDAKKYIENYMYEKLASERSLPESFSMIIGQDKRIRRALYSAYKASKADFPVLILGESGTGKELIARAIHENSTRRKYGFVGLNCAAIPTTLVESELFGYENGSFTNARKGGSRGLLDLAHKGTLLFDEIGDFELPTQAKILRVLEERVFRRVGGRKDIHLDLRIISATNKDLKTMIFNGQFREDLFYRINTMIIHIPPLRERGNDLTLLAGHFLMEFCGKYKKETNLSPESLDILKSYHWPGNVRELRNALDFAVNMVNGPSITPEDLPPYLVLSKAAVPLGNTLARLEGTESPGASPDASLHRKIMDSFEKELLEMALQKSRNRTEAMRLLGLSRRAFYLKLNKHNLINTDPC